MKSSALVACRSQASSYSDLFRDGVLSIMNHHEKSHKQGRLLKLAFARYCDGWVRLAILRT